MEHAVTSTVRNEYTGRRLLDLLALCFLAVIAVIYGLETYPDTFGERDPYRVMLGVLDAFSNGKSLANNVYGYGASSGYFFIVDFLRDMQMQPAEIARSLNLMSLLFAIWCFACTYCIARMYAGPIAALLTIAALATMPLWFYVSQYAHPMWPALALFLLSFLFVAISETSQGPRRSVFLALAVLALALAFTMRLDVVLAAPMFLAFCVKDNSLSIGGTVRALVVGVVSLAFAFGIIKLLPPLDPSGTSTLDNLLHWHNLTRFIDNFAFSQLRIARSLNIILISVALLSVLPLWRKRALPLLLLTLPTILINYLFWIPNPQPERHFLYMAPSLCLLAGFGSAIALQQTMAKPHISTWTIGVILTSAVGLAFAHLSDSPRFLYLASLPFLFIAMLPLMTKYAVARPQLVAGAVCIFAAIGFLAMPAKIAFVNPFAREYPRHFAEIGEQLASLPPLGKPLLVVSDGFLIASPMLAANPQLKVSLDPQWITVDTGTNRFELLIQGWIAETVRAELPKKIKIGDTQVFIDPDLKEEMMPLLSTDVAGSLFNFKK